MKGIYIEGVGYTGPPEVEKLDAPEQPSPAPPRPRPVQITPSDLLALPLSVGVVLWLYLTLSLKTGLIVSAIALLLGGVLSCWPNQKEGSDPQESPPPNDWPTAWLMRLRYSLISFVFGFTCSLGMVVLTLFVTNLLATTGLHWFDGNAIFTLAGYEIQWLSLMAGAIGFGLPKLGEKMTRPARYFALNILPGVLEFAVHLVLGILQLFVQLLGGILGG
ncbi:hypothetical protein M4951_10080 [Blastopirellula sp. J2-11]|uniref:hypothetical protein n=1 Tax=Blastopirellula sp. J2-11 TaxID=2943192 RepID=UPI0021C6919F|nr:hypothetical protein [Blastopirellula sp. J2-11]UUO08645.1 hypothetical protein M4951_10080 [Blastopirellula sp. J2-11]